MIVGSLAGPLCGGGGFCAGAKDVVEHQRISAASYTFSAALPAMLATTASETINLLQSSPEILLQCRENIKAMRAQLDPRSDWVVCTSDPENPIMLLVLKPDVVRTRRLTNEDQEKLLQECVDEVSSPQCLVSPRWSQTSLQTQSSVRAAKLIDIGAYQRGLDYATEEHATRQQPRRQGH